MGTDSYLDECLSRIGYTKHSKEVYRFTNATGDVEHFLYFEQFEKCRTLFTADFGFRNRAAQEFAMIAIGKFGHSYFANIRSRAREADCLIRFPFWRFVGMSRNSWELDSMGGGIVEIENDIERYLVPFAKSLRTKSDLLSRLAADSEPCPWFAGNAAIRAAMFAHIAQTLGADTGYRYSILSEHLDVIAAGLGTSTDPADFVDWLSEDLTTQIESRAQTE